MKDIESLRAKYKAASAYAADTRKVVGRGHVMSGTVKPFNTEYTMADFARDWGDEYAEELEEKGSVKVRTRRMSGEYRLVS